MSVIKTGSAMTVVSPWERDEIETCSSGEMRFLEWETPARTFRCEVRLISEEDGRWSAYLARLPGVTAFGDDEESALGNIKDAIVATLESYDPLETVPWLSEPEAPQPTEKTRWVVVNV